MSCHKLDKKIVLIYRVNKYKTYAINDFKDFYKNNNNYAEIILDINYRSSQSVLNFSNEVVKDNSGNIVELHCSYDPDTKGGNAPDGRKVKGTIHWVSAEHAFKTEVRLYDRLFNDEKPDSNKHQKDWKDFLNNESKKIIQDVYLEPSLELAKKEEFFQFERLGYFCVDNRDSEKGKPIFNRTVSLRDSWLKQKQKN